jgi:hypothetical protein
LQQIAPYNPCDESGNHEQVAAAHWECLRRNVHFGEIATHWLKSEKFRRSHVLTSAYHHQSVHFPRCALDWMLTPAQRLSLARFQVKRLFWFIDGRFNFGAIVSELTVSREYLGRKEVPDAYSLKVMPDAPPPLRLEHNWAGASAPFKVQYRVAAHQAAEFQDFTPVLRLIGRYLAAGDPHNEKQIFARELTEFGDLLYDMGEFHKVFGFPNLILTRKRLEADFAKVRETYKRLGLLRPPNQYPKKSYYGTVEDWRWFLLAEKQGLNWRKSSDLYQLARLYSDHIRDQFAARRPNAAPHGFREASVPSKVLRNRRSTLKRHCQSIHQWIDKIYPPAPAGKTA